MISSDPETRVDKFPANIDVMVEQTARATSKLINLV
jgi:hypothetical protein